MARTAKVSSSSSTDAPERGPALVVVVRAVMRVTGAHECHRGQQQQGGQISPWSSSKGERTTINVAAVVGLVVLRRPRYRSRNAARQPPGPAMLPSVCAPSHWPEGTGRAWERPLAKLKRSIATLAARQAHPYAIYAGTGIYGSLPEHQVMLSNARLAQRPRITMWHR